MRQRARQIALRAENIAEALEDDGNIALVARVFGDGFCPLVSLLRQPERPFRFPFVAEKHPGIEIVADERRHSVERRRRRRFVEGRRLDEHLRFQQGHAAALRGGFLLAVLLAQNGQGALGIEAPELFA